LRQRTAPAISTTPIALQRAISTERLLKTDKKTIVLEALGDGNFSLSAQGIDKPMTIMADEYRRIRDEYRRIRYDLAAEELEAVHGCSPRASTRSI
jgi:hypothetical protein